MANALTQKPIILDTDITTYTGASAVKALGGVQGVRVQKLVLAVGGSAVSVAGNLHANSKSAQFRHRYAV